MKIQIHILFILLFITFGYSQNKTVDYPNFIGKDFESIQKNKDWSIIDQVSGHLNNDSKKDMALVLESKNYINEKRCNDCDVSKNKGRIVLILLDEKEKLVVHTQNNKFIARPDEGGMALSIKPIIVIENREFIIFQQYTRSFQSYTFKFQEQQLNIIRANGGGVDAASGATENNKYDFIKGKLTIQRSNISSKDETTEIVSFNIKPKALSEFKEMYEWEVIKNHFL
ncbi:hypothetical protein [Kordia sp.]|uniref:hypothetical protein n=1 Tax=Kordia sp. TaxID=1965332 RepID=UPI003B58C029